MTAMTEQEYAADMASLAKREGAKHRFGGKWPNTAKAAQTSALAKAHWANPENVAKRRAKVSAMHAEGIPYKDIARELGISRTTVCIDMRAARAEG